MTEIRKLLQEATDRLNSLEKQEKPKFEVGKWYISKKGNLYFYQGDNKNSYGFLDNIWEVSWECGEAHTWLEKEASESYVLERLTKEAERRGYKEGAEVKDFSNNWTYKIDNDLTEYKHGILWMAGNPIMVDGIWAEIVKPEAVRFLDWLDDQAYYFRRNKTNQEVYEEFKKLNNKS